MVRIHTTASVRVSRQCVISLEVVDPKVCLNRVNRMGKLVNILVPCMERLSYMVRFRIGGYTTIVVSNYSRTWECRNDEN